MLSKVAANTSKITAQQINNQLSLINQDQKLKKYDQYSAECKKFINDSKYIVLLYFVETNDNGIVQGSIEWHAYKKNTIGGSEIATVIGANKYKSLGKLIEDKLNLNGNSFTGSYATRWGNVFEPIIAGYVEGELDTDIVGSGLFLPGAVPNQTYSPDGLGIVYLKTTYSETNSLTKYTHSRELLFNDAPQPIYPKIKDENREIANRNKNKITRENGIITVINHYIALFEFKCPEGRELNDAVPSGYIPQVLTGIESIPIVDFGVFVEGVFRRCAFADLNFGDKFNREPQPNSQGENAIAIGFIGFYIPEEKKETVSASEIYARINKYYNLRNQELPLKCSDSSVITDNQYDIGKMHSRMILDIILQGFMNGIVKLYYSKIYFNDAAGAEFTMKNVSNGIQNDYDDYCRIPHSHHLGIMGWKLFRAHFHIIEKKPFIKKYGEIIKETINTISRCRTIINNGTTELITPKQIINEFTAKANLKLAEIHAADSPIDKSAEYISIPEKNYNMQFYGANPEYTFE